MKAFGVVISALGIVALLYAVAMFWPIYRMLTGWIELADPLEMMRWQATLSTQIAAAAIGAGLLVSGLLLSRR